MKPKGFIPVVTVIIISVLALAAAGTAWYFATKKNEEPKTNINNVTNTNTATSETYIACGCGCCGSNPQEQCLYHAKGDDLTKIISDDKKASQSADCPTTGCSFGIKYRYCDVANTNANTATNATAEWRTYTNSVYDVSFNYPSEWDAQVKEENSAWKRGGNAVKNLRFSVRGKQGGQIGIDGASELLMVTVFDNTEGLSLQSWLDKYLAPSNEINFAKSDILDGGLKVVQSKNDFNKNGPFGGDFVGNSRWVYYVLESQDMTALADYGLKSSQDQQSLRLEILSTFTPLSDTTGWKTYTNSVYKFSMKYPADWGVTEKTTTDAIARIYPVASGNIYGPDSIGMFLTTSESIQGSNEPTTITVSGKQAKQGIEHGMVDFFTTIFPLDQKFLRITWQNIPNQTIQKTILSTLQFN